MNSTPDKNRLITASLVGLILILGTAAPVMAGNIALETYATCTVMEQGVLVNIKTANRGDEAAADLQFHLKFRGMIESSRIYPRLEPGRSVAVGLLLKPDINLPGSYPVQVLVDFHDLIGRPFTNLAYASFVHEEGVNPEVFIQPVTLNMDRRGRLNLEVLNVGRTDHQVRISLAVPGELKAGPASQTVTIKGGGRKKVSFELENRSAPDGSLYSILAFLEYEDLGRHYSLVTESAVSVQRRANFFKRHWLAEAILGTALLILAVSVQILSRPGEG